MTKPLTYVVSHCDGEHDNVIDTFTNKVEALDCYRQSIEERDPNDQSFMVEEWSDYDDEDKMDLIDTIAFVEFD